MLVVQKVDVSRDRGAAGLELAGAPGIALRESAPPPRLPRLWKLRRWTQTGFLQENLLAFAILLLVTRIGVHLVQLSPAGLPLWPSAGPALGLLMVFGCRAAPGVLMGGWFGLALSPMGGSVVQDFLISLGGCVQAFAGCWLLRRFSQGRDTFTTPIRVFRFLGLAGIATALVGPFLIMQMGLAFGWVPYPHLGLLEMWVANTVSILILTPLVVAWARLEWPRPNLLKAAEVVLVFVFLTGLTYLVFYQSGHSSVPHTPMVFLVLPLLMWAALRFGLAGATACLVTTGVMVVTATLGGSGPLAVPDPHEATLLLQGFLAISAIATLILSGDVVQRQTAEAELRRSVQRCRDLANLGRQLNAARSPREASFHIAKVADDLLGWDACQIDLCWPDGKRENVFSADILDGHKENCLPGLSTTAGVEAVIRRAIESGPQLVVRESPGEWDAAELRRPDRSLPVLSIVSVPVRSGALTVAVITMQSCRPNPFSEGDLALAQSLADHCGGVLERIRAVDEVTHLNACLEERVQERTAQLANANKELEAFSYSVSHDLRAPLRSILGFTEVLRECYNDRLDAPGQDYLRRTCDSARHMEDLIEDLLKLSRLGRAEMQFGRVDLTKLVSDLASEISQLEPARQVEWKIQPGLRALRADERLLRAALENLLRNAWKFTGRQPNPVIEFGRLEGDTFYVRDNGAGFDMTYAGRLFGVFQRLHPNSEFPGTGVGLATVQRIINRHGGRTWAEGAIGKGATFYFTLPG